MVDPGQERRKGKRCAAVLAVLVLAVLSLLVYVHWQRVLEQWYLWRLGSSDNGVKVHAAYRLAGIGTVDSVPRLAKAYLAAKQRGSKVLRYGEYTGPVSWFLEVAVWNIMYRDLEGSVPLLVRFIQDNDRRLRLFAVKALGLMGTAPVDAIPAVDEALRDPDPEIRSSAALSLKAIRGE